MYQPYCTMHIKPNDGQHQSQGVIHKRVLMICRDNQFKEFQISFGNFWIRFKRYTTHVIKIYWHNSMCHIRTIWIEWQKAKTQNLTGTRVLVLAKHSIGYLETCKAKLVGYSIPVYLFFLLWAWPIKNSMRSKVTGISKDTNTYLDDSRNAKV